MLYDLSVDRVVNVQCYMVASVDRVVNVQCYMICVSSVLYDLCGFGWFSVLCDLACFSW